MVELIVHFQCDTSKTTPRLPRNRKARQEPGPRCWYALNGASVAGPNWPSKSTPALGEIRIWRAVGQSCPVSKVLQLATCPDRSPVMNQRVRCSDEPCVKASGTT